MRFFYTVRHSKVRKYIENTSFEMQPGRAELASITTAGREYRQRRDVTAVWLHSKKKQKDRRPTDPIFFSHVTRNKVFFFWPKCKEKEGR